MTQAHKYRNLLKTTNQLASAGSEGGMKVYSQRLSVLQKILRNWLMGKEVQLKEHVSDLKEPFQDEDNFVILNENIKNLLDVEMSTTVKDEAITSPGSKLNLEEKEEESTMKIVMPPKIIKRGRPKGAEVTVIGLPSQKKPNLETRKGITCFSKLKPFEKDRFILECFVKPSVAFNALNGSRLVEATDITTNVIRLSDVIRDEESIDIKRIERYCDKAAWMAVLKLIEKKKKCKWTCSSCEKIINQNEESVACQRCLTWVHLTCTKLKKFPNQSKCFCIGCKRKYQD